MISHKIYIGRTFSGIAKKIAIFMAFAAFLSAVSYPASAQIGERIIQFRSIEDASNPPDPAVCSGLPFQANVKLGASLWTFGTRASDGLIMDDRIRQVGNATACTRVSNLAFPLFMEEPFYVRFNLEDGAYVGSGNCTILNSDALSERPILAGCTLKLVSAPENVIAGAATSMSVFNPFRIPTFNTGSIWTLHIFSSQ